ncbi:YidH family protein [Rhodococcus qingshengii]|uniref:YidH family protein n=1 Tax=Rhodococcus qingshengii TaxID=334542 RepID=UPI0010A6B2FF|nr:DUF202 domain-containing protein [Rhodococcus qingshengii]THJ66916.1 DUF202 domain-containing protein [Rhodococcus qingshengii]
MSDHRWPGWVYGSGEDPDYRFSFANERTLLAWIRTALALMAGGVAVDALGLALDDRWRIGLAATLVILGAVCALSAWFRWARAERAMRQGTSLPSSSFGLILGLVVVVIAIILLIAPS